MEKSAVILGLSRQAKFLGLPMPYAMAVGAMTVLPFILFKPVWWFLTAPFWYGLARVATKLNPNGHHVFAVMMQVTPMAILRKGRRHVSSAGGFAGQGTRADPSGPEDLCASALRHRSR